MLRDVDDDGISTTDLSEKELKSIPANICKEGHQVRTLVLSRNRSIQLNGDLGKFKNLCSLSLDDCGLSAVPEEVCDLVELRELILSRNDKLRSLNPHLARLSRLRKLDISSCSLTSIPDWLGSFEMLYVLLLQRNAELRSLNPNLARLTRLRTLNVSECSLKSVPKWLGNLQMLDDLLLERNKELKSLDSSLARLHQLKRLNVRWCSLTSIPDWLGDLQMLEELLLSSNVELGSLNPALARLSRLKTLDVSSCSLSSIPDWLGDLQMLEELMINSNKEIRSLNDSVARLSRLKRLDVSSCSLTSIPDWLGDLKMLTDLDLSNNQLEYYPECTLRLKSLKFLNLADDTCLSDGTRPANRAIEHRSATQSIWQSLLTIFTDKSNENHILTEDTGNEPTKGNRIKVLPVGLAFTNLRTLDLHGNPIAEPPEEVWMQGVNAIKTFMRAIIPGRQLMCADTINVIGDTGAGKTSIARSLVKGSPDPADDDDRTRVMHQHRFITDKAAGLSVNINDFGGHTIYHSVIPIFLPCDGLTILVYDMSKNIENQETTIKKWLLTVLAKSTNIRVIIAGTRTDKLSSEQRLSVENHVQRFSMQILKQAVEEVKACKNRLSCAPHDASSEKTLQDIHAFLLKLEYVKIFVVTLSCVALDQGLAALHDHVLITLRPPQHLPIQWCRVIKGIFAARPNGVHLEWEEVIAIARAHLTDGEVTNSIVIILRYLVTTSMIFWLEDHPQLGRIVFHSPRRLIEVCKKILDHDQALHNAADWASFYGPEIEQYKCGVLQESLLLKLLEGNNADSRVVTDFLQHFGIISPIASNSRQFIIPSNLGPEAPSRLRDFVQEVDKCSNSISIRLSFCGSIIPMGFFEISMCAILKVANDLDKEKVVTCAWRDGVIVCHDGVKFAAVRTDRVITLMAFSAQNDPSPWSILHLVVKVLNSNVISTWHGIPPDCAVLCPACRWNCRLNSKIGEIETSFKALAADASSDRSRRTCPVCENPLPQCLSYPIASGPFTKVQQDEINMLFKKMRYGSKFGAGEVNICTEPRSQRTRQEVIEVFEHHSSDIIERLTTEAAITIARRLEDKDMLLESERESVCLKYQTASEAASILLELVKKKKSVEIFQAFLDILELELKQSVVCREH